MQDARLRLFSTLFLSFAAFSGVIGAFLSIGWWLVFTDRFKSFQNLRLFTGLIFMIAVIAVITQFSGGDGLLYFIRMSAIILIAGWVFEERESGEFLDVCTWMFGNKKGSNLGLVAEMGITTIQLIEEDIRRIRIAMKLKGMKWDLSAIIPLATNIIYNQIKKTEEQSKILACRGYSDGGTLCPVFRSTPKDKIAFVFSFLIFTSGIIYLL
ncbi:MAG: hypothetical protein U9N40_08660 [Euryarchaeota archaeon]|nr:hypothetical protein [Euryarchaeota archaeon]